MLSLNFLKNLYPDERAQVLYKYLKNKNKGGTNNSKGNTFENYYTVYQIAKQYENKSNERHTLFSSQVLAFVDDLVITFNKPNKKHHRVKKSVTFFQIKDTISLSWTTGAHPLFEDFDIQHKITRGKKKGVRLYLVVSKDVVKENLDLDIPKSIENFTKIIHFPTANSISSLIHGNIAFKKVLIDVCAISNPSHDKLEALATIILGVWDASSKNKVSLESILSSCHNLNPNYIKGFSNRISAQLARILNSIEGFNYKIENGYVSWTFRNTDKGIVSYKIGSSEFLQFESDITNLEGEILFESIESYLI
jgi:hypothetical protein